MAIMSYLAYPRPGKGAVLAAALSELPGCAVYPAEGHELLVLVTDTPDEAAETALQKRLAQMDDMECLALVFGHAENDEKMEVET